MSHQVLVGDVLKHLASIPPDSINCVVTSPPYWGLRDYGVEGQIGLESTPAEFIAKMVEVFRQVRRVLRLDGTCWVNMGDSYAASPGQRKTKDKAGPKQVTNGGSIGTPSRSPEGFKPKDLCGMPWRLAFALQDDGWWLRQDIIWFKPNPMPESVTDRCTKAHEYLFLLTKCPNYFYDADAIRTKYSEETKAQSFDTMDYKKRDKYKAPDGWKTGPGSHGTFHPEGREKGQLAPENYIPKPGANKRSVWEIATESFSEAHFATFPTKLVEPCIRAGCPPGGTVLDPFSGSGTTGVVAIAERCNYIGIELNPEYAAMSERRLAEASAQGVLTFAMDEAASLAG